MRKYFLLIATEIVLITLFLSASAENVFSGKWHIKSYIDPDGKEVEWNTTLTLVLAEDNTYWFQHGDDDDEKVPDGTWDSSGTTIRYYYSDEDGNTITVEGSVIDNKLILNDNGLTFICTKEADQGIHVDSSEDDFDKQDKTQPDYVDIFQMELGLNDSEEALSTQGKELAYDSPGSDLWSGIYLYGGNKNHLRSYILKLRGKEINMDEPVTAAKVTFLEGDRHLSNFFVIEEQYNNPSGRTLTGCIQTVSQSGSASFRIDMVSEHYYGSAIINVKLANANDVTASLAGNIVNFPINQSVSVSNVFNSGIECFVLTEPEIPYSCSLFNANGEDNVETDEVDLINGNLTIKKPGNYPMILKVMLGNYGHEIEFSITIHADKSIEKASVVGKGLISSAEFPQTVWLGQIEKRTNHPGITTSEGTFTGEESVNVGIDGMESFLSEWTYVPLSLPNFVNLTENSAYPHLVTKENKNQKKLVPDTFSIEFLSGDDFLKEAVAAEFQYDEDGKRSNLELFVRNEFLTQPGQAVFRIRMGVNNLYYETDYTLRVLNWEDNPLVKLIDPSMAFPVSLNRAYFQHNLENMIVTNYAQEIASYLTADEKEIWLSNNRISVWPDNPQIQKGGLIKQGVGNLLAVYYGFTTPGSYSFTFYYIFGNIYVHKSVTFEAVPYGLIGPSLVRPGATIRYTPYTYSDSELQLSLSLEGPEGITMDEGGKLNVAEDIPVGTIFRVIASPSDGGSPIIVTSRVTKDIYRSLPWVEQQQFFGFSCPVPANTEDSEYSEYPLEKKAIGIFWGGDNDECSLELKYTANNLEMYLENPIAAEAWLNEQEMGDVTTDTIIQIDDHPARLVSGWTTVNENDYPYGVILWVRDNHWIKIQITEYPTGNRSVQEMQGFSLEDLRFIANMLSYSPLEDQPSIQDAEITINVKGDIHILSAGKSLQLSASFDNPTKVNKRNKNDKIEWSVIDSTTGEAPEGVVIDNRGNLSVAKTLEKVYNIEIKAYSPIFFTSSTYSVTVIPAVSKISIEPAELVFYVGADTPQIAKAVLEPNNVPPLAITWIPAKKDLVEITEIEDGIVSVRPLLAGKTTVEVKEPGGKSAKLNVSIVVPVETVEMTLKGKTVPGGTVTVVPAIQPENAGNKNVEWKLDVNESIATINEKGQIKINKETPVGTLIHITCIALGAPEPVTSSAEFIVTEK